MKTKQKQSKLILITLYALYLTFILLASTVYLAENEFRGKINEDKYNYQLIFTESGKQSHYEVTLTNPEQNGYIIVDYTPSTNLLKVETTNIRELKIDCRSIAKEKNEEILNKMYSDDTNAYKQYFIDKEIFNVITDTDHGITLILNDVPYPYKVIVNNKLWQEGFDYSHTNGRFTAVVPNGHSDVDIYFVSEDKTSPNARFTVEYEYLVPNSVMTFNASTSTDDGIITDYIWDFGDGNIYTGIIVEHKFSTKGQYRVILTVRDEDGLIDHYSRIIYVQDDNNNNLPDVWEDRYNVTEPNEDDDFDSLTNLNEYFYGTNPKNSDSDDDGFSDGDEVLAGSDPMDSASTPPKKEKREEGAPSWILFTGVGLVIVIIMLVFTYVSYLNRKRTKELERKKAKVKRKQVTRKVVKKREVDLPLPIRKPIGYAASTIPPEAIDTERKPLNPPERIPPSKPPTLQTLKRITEFHSKMIDEDMKLPEGAKIKYECPTCESTIGKNDEFCQKCGEQFNK